LAIAAVLGTLMTLMGPGVAQAWEQVGVPPGGACPDVLVIGARGSGQEPQANGGLEPADYAADPYNGMGQIAYDVYQRLLANRPQLHIAYEGVQYAAEPVYSSFQDPSLTSYFQGFIANAKAGGPWMAQEVGLVDAKCKHHTKFVLSGYSQGAWAVHHALMDMSSTLRKQVVGVTLFGDPLYVAGTSINRINNLVNLRNGLAYPVDRSYANVPKDIQARTGSYCHTLDPVCQSLLLPAAPHYTYVSEGNAVQAADFISQHMPAPTAWTKITSGDPPNGQVGSAYKFTFKASFGVGAVTFSSVGELPRGLSLSSRGVLSGSPTMESIFSFKIKATDTIGRYDIQPYSIRIDDPNVPPPPPSCSPSVCNALAWGGYGSGGGELGNGSTLGSLSPVQVSNVSGAKAVSAGELYSMALTNDGTVWTWGYNYRGELGNGTTTQANTPAPVPAFGAATAVSAGEHFSLALHGDGTVWAAGRNNLGQLGDGTTTDSSTPKQVQGLPSVTTMAAGIDHALAIRADGSVWTWGSTTYDWTNNNVGPPQQVSGISGVTAVAAGNGHDLALRSDGTVWAWGDNRWGELGNGTTTPSSTPVQVINLTGAVSIAAGYTHSLVVLSDGTVWGFGLNGAGQLGNGTPTDINTAVSTPVQTLGLTGVRSVAAGGSHSLAIRNDGSVWAWGGNAMGQVGDGTTTVALVPAQVPGVANATSIDGGATQTLVVHN
jgi:alpha-tubulin suppressor-like RCC1 family protein